MTKVKSATPVDGAAGDKGPLVLVVDDDANIPDLMELYQICLWLEHVFEFLRDSAVMKTAASRFGSGSISCVVRDECSIRQDGSLELAS